jgi:hypothetical protein
MRNLDTSLSRKEEAFSECVSEKTGIEEKLKTVSKDSVQKSADIKSLQEINVRQMSLSPYVVCFRIKIPGLFKSNDFFRTMLLAR